MRIIALQPVREPMHRTCHRASRAVMFLRCLRCYVGKKCI